MDGYYQTSIISLLITCGGILGIGFTPFYTTKIHKRGLILAGAIMGLTIGVAYTKRGPLLIS